MRRRLFTILAALSLVLCVTVAVLWVRSATHPTYVGRHTDRMDMSVIVDRGFVGFLWIRRPSDAPFPARWTADARDARFPSVQTRWSYRKRMRLYVAAYEHAFTRRVEIRSVHVHASVWVVLLGIMPVLYGVRMIRRAAPPCDEGPRCPACGYDLRATPERCPECGRDAGVLVGRSNAAGVRQEA